MRTYALCHAMLFMLGLRGLATCFHPSVASGFMAPTAGVHAAELWHLRMCSLYPTPWSPPLRACTLSSVRPCPPSGSGTGLETGLG